MNSPAVSVRVHATAEEAAQTMRDRGIGFLPVVDDEGRSVGVVTDRDLAVRLCAEGRAPAEAMVADIMTPTLLTCRDSDPLHVAESLMTGRLRSRIGVEDADFVEPVPLADFIVVEIMSGRDLERAGAEFFIDVLIGDERHDAAGDRQADFLAVKG